MPGKAGAYGARRVSKEAVQGVLLPGPPGGRWFPILLPGWVRTALLSDITQSVRTGLRSNRKSLVIVGTYGFERFYGAFRPGKNSAFQHTSILVRPRQDQSRVADTHETCRLYGSALGGAAGYRPRVRCAYCTPQFIAISGQARHFPI